MQNAARKRLDNELRNYYRQRQENDDINIEVVDADKMSLKAYIKGVEDTPYAGGTFVLDIKIGEHYPLKPPTIKFVTKIWHPSVNPFDGSVCLYDDVNGFWPVSMTIDKILLWIQSWLSTVTSKEPIDVEILEQAKKKSEIFKKTAEFWTIKFAGSSKPIDPDCLEKVRVLSRLTRNESLSIVALSYNNWELPSEVNDGQTV